MVVNVSLKNLSSESTYVTNGSLFVLTDGKEYQFDKAETIMDDNYGFLFEKINPMVSVSTNVFFKIPDDLTGTILYQPGEISNKILLGTL